MAPRALPTRCRAAGTDFPGGNALGLGLSAERRGARPPGRWSPACPGRGKGCPRRERGAAPQPSPGAARGRGRGPPRGGRADRRAGGRAGRRRTRRGAAVEERVLRRPSARRENRLESAREAIALGITLVRLHLGLARRGGHPDGDAELAAQAPGGALVDARREHDRRNLSQPCKRVLRERVRVDEHRALVRGNGVGRPNEAPIRSSSRFQCQRPGTTSHTSCATAFGSLTDGIIPYRRSAR
jgi:hypothetical protein